MPQCKRYQVTSPNPATLANNFRMRYVSNPRWKRALLEISRGSLVGTGPRNVDLRDVATASRIGVEVANVVEGRNYFCGDAWVATTNTDSKAAYQIGSQYLPCVSLPFYANCSSRANCTNLGITLLAYRSGDNSIHRFHSGPD